MKFIAIIPARAGSKRVPGKNSRLFLSKPLIHWTVEAATQSSQIDQVWITTNDPKILKMDFKQPVNLWKRPHGLAKDDSPMIDVVTNLLLTPAIKKESFTHFILLQPTSPKRTKIHIDEAITLFKNHSCNSLFSVTESRKHPWKELLIKEGRLFPAVNAKYLNQNIQSLPKSVSQNGAIYIAKISLFLKNQSFFINKCIPYLMDESASLDIDTEEGFKSS